MSFLKLRNVVFVNRLEVERCRTKLFREIFVDRGVNFLRLLPFHFIVSVSMGEESQVDTSWVLEEYLLHQCVNLLCSHQLHGFDLLIASVEVKFLALNHLPVQCSFRLEIGSLLLE